MKIFMDTANVEEIAKFVDWGVVTFLDAYWSQRGCSG